MVYRISVTLTLISLLLLHPSYSFLVHPFVISTPISKILDGVKSNTIRHSFQNKCRLQAGIVVGETKGAVLLLEDIEISQGSNQILKDINLRIERNQRWGIVGPNGAGKSTLLGSITGLVRTDSGKATIAPKVQAGYLRQTAVSGSIKTVFEEASSEMKEINLARERMKKAEEIIEKGDISDKALTELDESTKRFADVGGWTQSQEVDSVLKGLGFKPEDSHRLCSEFSGGWQMRIALARLLLSKPNLLLLDEPSNHLDSSARDWLGNYLSKYVGSMVLVSHDISLLSVSVNNIAEVASGTLTAYASCNYDKYLEEKDFRAKSAMAEYERNVAEAARLQAFVDKFGASATKASSAQSRVKMIEKMRKEGKLEPPPNAVVANRIRPSLTLPPPPKSMGEVLLELKHASIGHDSNSAPLLKNINMKLTRGMKLVLRGPNGAGKSTLVSTLRGKIPLLDGKFIQNEYLRLGSFTQDLAQELEASARAVDLVTSYAREGKYGDVMISDEEARGIMGKLGLTGDKPLRKVKELSGGEKARVALAMFALKANNVLMLDEPSNHLDIECVKSLGLALSNWGHKDGVIVVVSHDRSFCDEVGFTHVGTVANGSLIIEERDLNNSDWELYDIENKSDSVHDESTSSAIKAMPLTPEEEAEMKKKRKEAYNAPKRIQKLESLIEKSELIIADLDEEMMKVGNDVGKLVDINEKKEIEQGKIMKMMEEWEELEELLATIK